MKKVKVFTGGRLHLEEDINTFLAALPESANPHVVPPAANNYGVIVIVEYDV